MVITGGSSGIGLAAARLFAVEGARLALIARGTDALEQAVGDVREAGGEAHAFAADVADRHAVRAAVESAAVALGGLDVLVPNAGAAAYGRFDEVPARDFERTLAVSFHGLVDTVRTALPHLRASRGVIVADVSIASKVPTPGLSAYAAAKAAVRGFLGTLRTELRHERSGVRVCMVHPGPVDTPFWRRLETRSGMRSPVPPGAYREGEAARALVECAIRPRAEVTVGGVAGAAVAAFALLGPALDPAAVLWAKGTERFAVQADEPGILWRPTPPAAVGDRGGGGRSSLWARARLARARAADALAARSYGAQTRG